MNGKKAILDQKMAPKHYDTIQKTDKILQKQYERTMKESRSLILRLQHPIQNNKSFKILISSIKKNSIYVLPTY